MKLITDISSFREYDSIATIGFFDGVHLGHRFLLDKLKDIALWKRKKTLVITFENHPRTVLKSDYLPPLLTTNEEKIRLLEKTEIDACLMLPFTQQMANHTAQKFFRKFLYQQLQINTLLIGHDHRFGKKRAASFVDCMKYGYEYGIMIEAGDVYFSEKDKHLSSSYIRDLLLQGNIAEANRLLGYQYSIQGEVVKGKGIGAQIGFPTANLSLPDERKLVPERGVYAVSVFVNGEFYKGMLNIGCRPTIGDENEKSIEVHILNFNSTIYSEKIDVFFVDKIRDEQRFNTIEKLTLQLQKDKRFVEKMTF